MKRSMTLRYTLHQMAYWATCAGVMSFTTAYLLAKGFAASTVGILLSGGTLLSFASQPLLAAFADRRGGNILKQLTMGLSGLSMLCFCCVQLLALPRWLFGVLYLFGIFSFDAITPLLNSINVAYSARGSRINYGLSRGIGSLAYSLSALAMGRVIADWGEDWMIWISLALLLCNVLIVAGYPNINLSQNVKDADTSCSIPNFFRRYKWYCCSLLGIMLLGMFHAMTENYLIEIVQPLGGDSGSVGVALFIATFVEMLVLLFFEPIRKRISDAMLLKLGALSFLLKAVLLMLAPSVTAIYIIQLLQATSYTFISPTQMYYADSKVGKADMVKGQAFITAAYTLGCAIGNFSGGQLLEFFDLKTMLMAGIAMAAAGTLILFATVGKQDKNEDQIKESAI